MRFSIQQQVIQFTKKSHMYKKYHMVGFWEGGGRGYDSLGLLHCLAAFIHPLLDCLVLPAQRDAEF
jgi:hypothetical protein